jgi:F0F1-type ATP synthase epsilon subunit
MEPPQTQAASLNTSAEKIHVTVRNRIKVLFDEDVKSLTSKNDTGIFDILPEHSNFISLITSPLVLRKITGQKQEISFKSGLIIVKENSVHCYIDLLIK